MKRAIGYIRVSTEEQARGGLSLDAQRSKIRAYAELHDLDLRGILEDPGVSAKTLDRPGVQEALRQARAHEVDAVIVFKLDRLSRSVPDVLSLIDDVFSNGVALHSISENLDTHSAAGRFVVTVLAALSQMEREQIGERTAAVLAHKRQEGRVYGEIPYGYTRAGNLLEKDPKAQDGLRLMRAMRTGHSSYRAIADTLNELGYPTAKGGQWYPSTVKRILDRATPQQGLGALPLGRVSHYGSF